MLDIHEKLRAKFIYKNVSQGFKMLSFLESIEWIKFLPKKILKKNLDNKEECNIFLKSDLL